MLRPNKGKVHQCVTYISAFLDSNSTPWTSNGFFWQYLCHRCHHRHHHCDHFDTHAQQASGGGAQQKTSASGSLIGTSSNISADIFVFKYICRQKCIIWQIFLPIYFSSIEYIAVFLSSNIYKLIYFSSTIYVDIIHALSFIDKNIISLEGKLSISFPVYYISLLSFIFSYTSVFPCCVFLRFLVILYLFLHFLVVFYLFLHFLFLCFLVIFYLFLPKTIAPSLGKVLPFPVSCATTMMKSAMEKNLITRMKANKMREKILSIFRF